MQLTSCGSIFTAPNTIQPFFTLGWRCLECLTGLNSSGGIYFTTSLSIIYRRIGYISFHKIKTCFIHFNTCIRVVSTFFPFFNHNGYTPIFLPIKPVRFDPWVHVAGWISSALNGDLISYNPLLSDATSDRNSLFSGVRSSL